MASSGAQKRLGKELADLKQNPLAGMNVSLVAESDIFKWQVLIDGPENTPYAGGVFNLQLNIPNDYPFKPPVLNFKTKIYHPNVADDGSGGMCLGLLRPDQWKPNSKLSTVLVFVQQILQDPVLDDPVSANIANELKNDKKAFTKTAKEWTRKYAKGKSG
ncbi:MAG: hypothetical protein Q9191_006469 [Dirinaria sp. TL-2023a]